MFDDEFHRIREFRSGDNPRTIHWRSTARCGQLMVQEFHQNYESGCFILLDLCAHDDFSDSEIELAVSAAATLCVSRTYNSSDVQSALAVTGQTAAFVCDTRASRFANEALDVLAECQPGKSPPLDHALRRLTDAGALQRSQGIVITSRPKYCKLTLSPLCADLVPDSQGVMKRMVIVPATAEALREVFKLDGENEASGYVRSLPKRLSGSSRGIFR